MDLFVCVCEFSHFSQQCENLINCFCSFDISFAFSRTKAHLLISHFTLSISFSVMPAQKETMYDSNFRGGLLLHRCQLRQHTLQHLSVLYPGFGSEAVSTVNDLKTTSWMNILFSSQFQIRGSAVGTVCLPFPRQAQNESESVFFQDYRAWWMLAVYSFFSKEHTEAP